MRLILLLAAISVYLGSCVSLDTRKYTGFRVRTNPDNHLVYDCEQYELLEIDGDTIVGTSDCGTYKLKGYDSKAFLVRKRSSQKASVTITDNIISRTVYIVSRKSGKYPRKVYIDMRDTGNYYTYFKQPRQGDFQLILSPAVGNVWGFSFGKKARGATPMLGTALGLSRWYDSKHFISVSAGIASATSGFCPDGCRYIDSIPVRRERQIGYYANLQHHHLLRRVDIGYGVYLARHNWETYDIYMGGDHHVDGKKSLCLGPAISTHFQIFTFLYGGFEYQPMFFTIDKTTPKGYQHILNIGVQFRFTPKRPSRW